MARPIVRGTAAWKYFGDFRDGLLAEQVLVLQVAHPVVAAGVRDHSDYTSDPWTRLMRTVASLSIYVYGGAAGARVEAARLRALHRTFTGVADGRRYSALDPAAYAWVHATLVKAPVDAQRLFGKPLSTSELSEYYAQMRDIGLVLGVRERDLPRDWAAFERYYDAMVAGFGVNPAIDQLFETIRTAPKPVKGLPDAWWRRLQREHLFLVRATLPPSLRATLGLPWTDVDQRRFTRFAAGVRIASRPIPAWARTAPMRWVGKLNVWLRAHPKVYRALVRGDGPGARPDL
ncbi:oxygenase MpaB family protein [Amycolatopsis sp. DG1A-15b]|uniref:oxygenase MpaB family protein n=1 Tax=Amycolatopsis sp. DG1A-15b TaxID=3052846 RepID=UPI00255BFF63|nr:oxygenase MpaB family protein [Amycolatopsis sp. DG1A-15b]WIX87205.1 oxygenase MpaB family protein [Amycolatopsis sp. DG1A-15b]